MIVAHSKVWRFIVAAGTFFTAVAFFATPFTYQAAENVTENATITADGSSYLPLVICERKPVMPWERLHGYASYKKLTELQLNQLSEYTNFVYTFHRANIGWPDQADLEALRQAGMGALLKLDSNVVEDVFDEAELLELKARIDPYKDVIWAIAVIDEPYRPDRQPPLTEAELAALVDRVKAIFPDYLMYVNFLAPYYVEQATGEPHPGVPDNIDLISTDIYIHLEQTSGEEEYKMRVGRNLEIMLDRAHGRPVFYAAPAYGLKDDPTTWPSPLQAQLDYDLYQEYNLVGLGWYFYEEQNPGGDAWGASYWQELLEKQRQIGSLILGGG